jgi:hypothetical protein
MAFVLKGIGNPQWATSHKSLLNCDDRHFTSDSAEGCPGCDGHELATLPYLYGLRTSMVTYGIT